jgi:hypothetical protein
MKHPLARLRRMFLAITALVGVIAARAADPQETWSRYFPEQTAAPADESGWATLAETFPHRVKPAATAVPPPAPTPAATRLAIKSGIDYVRVRQLVNDRDAIRSALATPRVIIDLRYVHADLSAAREFGSLLARQPRPLESGIEITPSSDGERPARQVVLCLVNRATSGALEAVLDALQHAGDVLLVGTQTAGDTGHFVPVDDAPAWRVIAGDHRRSGGHSLLDVGVTPGLFVETTPDAEDAAYLAFDASKPVADLLDVPVVKPRFDEARLMEHFQETYPGNGGSRSLAAAEEGAGSAPDARKGGDDDPATPSSPGKSGDASVAAEKSDEPPPFDRSLQRAVATLIADTIFRDRQQVR